jgi:competence protein ComEC
VSSLEPSHPLLATAGERAVPTRPCRAGDTWHWDGIRFEVLYPDAPVASAPLRANTVSCVLRVGLDGLPGGPSVLLTGDIEREQELALVARHGHALATEVMLVPHHGSRTSSSAEFLRAVSPRFAVVQAGYKSRFGHPAPDVVRRYAEQGAEVIASPACGAWRWTSDEPGFRCWRDSARRYWHHPGDGPAALLPAAEPGARAPGVP